MKVNKGLISIIYNEDLTAIKYAINDGTLLKFIDSDGRNALMLTILSLHKSPDIISLLLEGGADTNHKDKGQGWSALAFAARECSPEVCALLLDHGAEVDSQDTFGNTPLWRAVQARREDNIKLLVNHGANPNHLNKSGSSPNLLAQQLGLSYFD